MVESAKKAVSSGTYPRSASLINGPDSEQPHDLSEVNSIGLSGDIWVPFVRPPAGQATPYGIGARMKIHPPAHVPRRGKCGLYCIGEEVALSSGEMNKEE